MMSFVNVPSIAIVTVVAAVVAAAAQPHPGSDHDTLEECYDYQFNQYVAGDGNFDNYDWGMNECEETYGAAAALPPGYSSVKAFRTAVTQKALQIRPKSR